VASAPVSFGVDEVVADDAWMPAPDDVLAWMADIGYEGTEMGPPGYLGPASRLREQLVELGLELVGAFLLLHLKDTLTHVRDDVAGRGGALDEAVRLGVFCRCGDGDSGIDAIIRALLETGYHGWVVVEQDQFLGHDDTPETLVAGQAADRRSLRARGL